MKPEREKVEAICGTLPLGWAVTFQDQSQAPALLKTARASLT